MLIQFARKRAFRYTVTEDLHVVPGARLTIAPGSIFEFKDGVGMLVQGELTRTEFYGLEKQVVFTAAPFTLPQVNNIRLVDEDGSDQVAIGRLEVGKFLVLHSFWFRCKLMVSGEQSAIGLGLLLMPEWLVINWDSLWIRNFSRIGGNFPQRAISQ